MPEVWPWVLTMPRRGDGPPEASTLSVTSINVGEMQESGLAKLRNSIRQWLGDDQGPAVIGLDEIAPSIAIKIVATLENQPGSLRLGLAMNQGGYKRDGWVSCLLWRAPLQQLSLIHI